MNKMTDKKIKSEINMLKTMKIRVICNEKKIITIFADNEL